MFLNINDTYEWIAERNSRINKQTLKIKLKIVIGWVIIKHWEEWDVIKWQQFENNCIWEGPITN